MNSFNLLYIWIDFGTIYIKHIESKVIDPSTEVVSGKVVLKATGNSLGL